MAAKLKIFLGLSERTLCEIAKKCAFSEIFKPIIWTQLCAYGNQKFTDFFGSAAQAASRE